MSSKPSISSLLENVAEWKDNQVCQTLFSPFTQLRDVNPESYDFRLNFWIQLITKATSLGLLSETQSVFVAFDSTHISAKFQRNGLQPAGIAHVMHTMVQSSSVLFQPQGPGLVSSALKALGKIARSVAGLFYDQEEPEMDIKYHQSIVLNSLLNDAATTILSHAENNGVFIYTYDGFKELAQRARASMGLPLISDIRDFDLLLKYCLEGQYATSRTDTEGFLVLKLDPKRRKIPVTDQEFNVPYLWQVRKKLEAQIQSIEISILNCRNKADSLRSNQEHDTSLKAYELKRIGLLEKTRQRYIAAIQAIDEMLMQIEELGTNREVVKSMKIGNEILSSLLKDMDISEIHEIKDDIEGLLEQSHAINEMISYPLALSPSSESEETVKVTESSFKNAIKNDGPVGEDHQTTSPIAQIPPKALAE